MEFFMGKFLPNTILNKKNFASLFLNALMMQKFRIFFTERTLDAKIFASLLLNALLMQN
jgi:hypothetical protein